MNVIKVPHLPIKEFDVSEVEKKFPVVDDNQSLTINELLEQGGSDRDVGLVLHGMGMEKYFQVFKNENIDLDTFLHLNDQDLLELGITDIEDRKIIMHNLKAHQTNTDEFTVPENHLDDLKIAKNVHNQLLLLQNYCAYAELQIKKHNLTDYRINSKETALTYLRAFTQSAIIQTKLMSNRLFNEYSSDNLIRKALKVNNLKLPKHLEEKLFIKKGKKKKIILKVAVLLGFSSVIILIGKYLVNKK